MAARIFQYRYLILAALFLLLVGDSAVYFGWVRNPEVVGDADPAQVAVLESELDTLRAEEGRIRRIHQGVPKMDSRAREFMEGRLPGNREGYRVLAEDLNAAAQQAGVVLDSLNSHESFDEDRPGLLRIEMDSDIEGTFAQLLRFMDILERTPSLYLMTDLAVVEEDGGRVEVRLKTVTYFRRQQG